MGQLGGLLLAGGPQRLLGGRRQQAEPLAQLLGLGGPQATQLGEQGPDLGRQGLLGLAAVA